jgi:hypothetical protein
MIIAPARKPAPKMLEITAIEAFENFVDPSSAGRGSVSES